MVRRMEHSSSLSYCSNKPSVKPCVMEKLRDEKLIDKCEEWEWKTEIYYLAVESRGCIGKDIANRLRRRFGYSNKEIKSVVAHLRETAEKASPFILLKKHRSSSC